MLQYDNCEEPPAFDFFFDNSMSLSRHRKTQWLLPLKLIESFGMVRVYARTCNPSHKYNLTQKLNQVLLNKCNSSKLGVN